MATGEELIAAIVTDNTLMQTSNCPGVPVAFGQALYGSVQSDIGDGIVISSRQEAAYAMSAFGETTSTAVWHVSITPTHHFVIVPWYRHEDTPGQAYSVFMAYEYKYKVKNYVKGGGIAPAAGGKGYKPSWNGGEMIQMFDDLLNSDTAWEEYFGQVGANRATQIKMWKYGWIPLQTAIDRVSA